MTEQVDQRSGLPDSYVTQELVDYELGCLRQIFAQHRQLVDNAEDLRAIYSIYSVILLEQQREWIDEATKGTIEEVAYAVAVGIAPGRMVHELFNKSLSALRNQNG